MSERKPIKGITIESTEKLIAETLSEMPEKAAKKRKEREERQGQALLTLIKGNIN